MIVSQGSQIISTTCDMDQMDEVWKGLPTDVAYKVFAQLSFFECLGLSTMSKGFNSELNSDSFWDNKVVEMTKFGISNDYGVSLRSQIVIKAIFEYRLMKSSVVIYYNDTNHEQSKSKLDGFLKGYGCKLSLINTVEMARKAAKLSPLFLGHLSPEFKSSRSFFLDLIDIPRILFAASDDLQKDKKLNMLATLHHGPTSCSIGNIDENFCFIQPEHLNAQQEKLFINQIKSSIRAEILSSSKVTAPTSS